MRFLASLEPLCVLCLSGAMPREREFEEFLPISVVNVDNA